MASALINGDDAADPAALERFLGAGGCPNSPFAYFSGLYALGIDGAVLTRGAPGASSPSEGARLFGSPPSDGDPDELRELLISPTDEPILNEKHRFAPLHIAAMSGNEECVRILLKYGASPAAQDAKGRSPADVAHPSIVCLFQLDPEEQTKAEEPSDREINDETYVKSDSTSYAHVQDINIGDGFINIGSPVNPIIERNLGRSRGPQNATFTYICGSPFENERNEPVPRVVDESECQNDTEVIKRLESLFLDFGMPYPKHLALELYGFLILAGRNRNELMVPGRLLQEAIDLLLLVDIGLAGELEAKATSGGSGEEINDNQPLLLWQAVKYRDLAELDHSFGYREQMEREMEQAHFTSIQVLKQALLKIGHQPIVETDRDYYEISWNTQHEPALLFSKIFHPVSTESAEDGEHDLSQHQYDSDSEVGHDEQESQSETFDDEEVEHPSTRIDVLTPALLELFYEIYDPDGLGHVMNALNNGTCSLKEACEHAQSTHVHEWHAFVYQNIQPLFDGVNRRYSILLQKAREWDQMDEDDRDASLNDLKACVDQLRRQWGARENLSPEEPQTEFEALLERFLSLGDLLLADDGE